MKKRCSYKKNDNYEYYGGRGIKVCERWINSFENFLKDMLPTWSPGKSIDRIDPNGNYTKENCRWADGLTQKRNKRSVRKIKNSLGQVFNTQRDASIHLNIKTSNINKALKGIRKSAGKDKDGNPIRWFYFNGS